MEFLFWIIYIPLLFWVSGKFAMWLDYELDFNSDILFWVFIIGGIFGVLYLRGILWV